MLLYAALAGVWAFGALGIALPVVAPLAAGATAWVGVTALEAALSQRDRRRITRQFRARVSPQLVDYLVANPNALSVAGKPREATVLFTDLAGFTAVSEALDGPATVALLNRTLGGLARVLTARGAYVNKFLGDGVMAFWSAFGPDPDQAEKACRAAVECQAEVERVNDENEASFARRTSARGTVKEAARPRLATRIGITTGPVIVGDCGAPPDLNDYTVIGDNVNLAARLESANKQFGTSVLIDGRTRRGIAGTDIKVRPLGRVVVVGQTKPVEVFEVLPDDAPAELIELTERGVQSFAARDFRTSRQAFLRLIERFGQSKLARAYLRAIAEAEERPEEFDGVLRLREK
jgi:adenylate cyclase